MTKKFASIAVAASLLLSACGDTLEVDKKTYDTYGVFNAQEQRNPELKYKLIIGNVIWSIILVETIIAPIYFFGFSLYEPVGLKCKPGAAEVPCHV